MTAIITTFAAGSLTGLLIASAVRWAQAKAEADRAQDNDDDYARFLASLDCENERAERVARATIPTICP